MCPTGPDANQGITFVLSQLGFHVSMSFAEALEPLGLLPPHVAIVQLVAREPGLSQQALANRIGIPANRLVALIDELEARGLIRRERPPTDRRVFALHATADGDRMLARANGVSAELEKRLTAPLSAAEREQLLATLRRIADAEGLEPGVHPGLRKLLR